MNAKSRNILFTQDPVNLPGRQCMDPAAGIAYYIFLGDKVRCRETSRVKSNSFEASRKLQDHLVQPFTGKVMDIHNLWTSTRQAVYSILAGQSKLLAENFQQWETCFLTSSHHQRASWILKLHSMGRTFIALCSVL